MIRGVKDYVRKGPELTVNDLGPGWEQTERALAVVQADFSREMCRAQAEYRSRNSAPPLRTTSAGPSMPGCRSIGRGWSPRCAPSIRGREERLQCSPRGLSGIVGSVGADPN